MKSIVAKFTFKIPEPHAQAGEKVEKTFSYDQCESNEEASEYVAKKVSEAKTPDAKEGWSLRAMVNDVIKANARSNSYQAALAPYRPSEVPAEDIKERMIRDYIRLGIPEDAARKQVEALLASMPVKSDAPAESVQENQ